MAEQLANGLWRLDIPLVGNPLKNLNSYLILGERSLLIDTGFRQQPCREAMEEQLAQIGVDRDRMDIFCTHLHSDHVGLVAELIRPGCRAYIGEMDGQPLQRCDSTDYWRMLYGEYVRDGFSREEMEELWYSNPAKNGGATWREGIYTLLKDGEVLHYGGEDLRCILTAGHTPGHLCLYDDARKRLFCGDHVLFHITPNICRWIGVADSLGNYLRSLDETAKLEVKELYPGHRAETGNLQERIAQLKAHHARRLEEARSVVTRSPGLTAYEIAGEMHWSIRSRNWLDFPLNQKFFAVGEALAHLDHLEALGQVFRREEGGKRRYFAVQA